MAYTVKNDSSNLIVYDPRIDDAILIDPVLHQKDNAVNSFECRMYSGHPDYANLQKRRTTYAIYKNDAVNPIFKGVLVSGTDVLAPFCDLYFEDFIGVLRDSMQDAFEFTGTPEALFQQFITAHNAQVQNWQKVTAGIVTVTDPNNYINRSSETELSTWEAIQTRLIDTLGGHLRMRYSNGTAYVDYLKGDTSSLDPNLHTSTQVIEFGENLKDFSRVVSSAETYTACIPKGAEAEFYDAEGEVTTRRLTIEDVNGGSKWLVNSQAVALYGFRCAPLDLTTWDDVTIPANLKSKGEAWLNGTGVKLSNTIRLSAADLHHLGVAADSMGFLDYVQVSVYPYSIDATYLLTEISIPINNPSELSISLGETFLTIADRQAKGQKETAAKIEDVAHSVSENQAVLSGEISESQTEYRTLVEQTSSSILSKVSETYTSSSSFADYQTQVSTMFTQTENDFNLAFQSIQSTVTTLDGEVKQQFAEQLKYIRFVDGNIIIGVEGNELTLKLANDRISFLSNNAEIAYFSSGRLYVSDVSALQSLTLWNFTFKPDGSGGMALKYTGV